MYRRRFAIAGAILLGEIAWRPAAASEAIPAPVIEDRPVPQAGPGEVVVRIRSVGVCGSDTHYYDHGRIGSFVVEAPLVLGHEAAGEVTEVGPGVTRLAVGQRVWLNSDPSLARR